jgi:hypothetical protein
MTLTQTKPQTQSQPKIWEAPTAEAEINDIIRKPYTPIAKVVGKGVLKDGRTILIVVFPACHDRHVEEWVVGKAQPAVEEPIEVKAVVEAPAPTVKPAAPKKLMLSLVAVKRITSGVPAGNFDRNELEIAGELSLAIGGFVIPPVVVRDSGGYKVVSGHFQYHAAVLARRLNPKAGETISAIVLESENQSAALAQLEILKLRAA